MSGTRATPGAVAGAASGETSQQRLRGSWIMAARVTWLLFIASTLTVPYARALPSFFHAYLSFTPICACVTYAVQETAAPTGYALDDTAAHNVSVSQNSTSGDGKEATFSASDTPLSQITVSFHSKVAGATARRRECYAATLRSSFVRR
jgi:hypothetical protein